MKQLLWGLLPLALVLAVPTLGTPEQGPASGKEPWFHAVAVRYQVKNVQRSVAFYTKVLGLRLIQPEAPPFAKVAVGPVELWLSGPKSSGSRPLADGRTQEPGGWNRIALQVKDLGAVVGRLKASGVKFRNEIVSGPGGKQIQIEDPDGNPIELFEPAG